MLRKRRHENVEIWPGFVDSLAILLMVIVFVLMTFVVAQLYLTDELSGRNRDLALLREQIGSLEKIAKEKDESSKKIFLDLKKLKIILLEAQKTAELLTQNNKTLSDEKKQLDLTKINLEKQLQIYLETVQKLKNALQDLQLKSDQKEENLKQLQKDALSFEDLKRILSFRSEFIENLKKALGDRPDIRIVGDRFVFQAEVLFAKGSAELDAEGNDRLDQLVNALKEIALKIPVNVPWVLRVDGHTDNTPIRTSQFPSNWGLSMARALAVVKYMIAKGVESKRLVAAGFGEFQPLAHKKGEFARNRRIEFKLDLVTTHQE